MYANPEVNPYQSIFVALYQKSVTLPGFLFTIYIDKVNTISLVRRMEVAEVQGVTVTYVSHRFLLSIQHVPLI